MLQFDGPVLIVVFAYDAQYEPAPDIQNAGPIPVCPEGIFTDTVAFVLETGTDIKAVELADVKEDPFDTHNPEREFHPLFNPIDVKVSLKELKAFSLVYMDLFLLENLRI